MGTPEVSLNRFFSLVQEGMREVKLWSMRRTAYELVALELDLVGTKRFEELIVEAQKAPGGENDPGNSTNSRRPDAIDQATRKSCANGLAIAIFLMSAEHSRRKLVLFVEVAKTVEQWHSRQVRACRSASQCFDWQKEQVAEGGCMRHICILWAASCLSGALVKADFWVPVGDGRLPSEEVAMSDDGLAREVGRFTLALIFRRIARTLPLTIGWPAGAIRLLGAPEVAAAEARKFMNAYDRHLQVAQLQNQCTFCAELARRSIFQRLPVKQLLLALQESGGAVSEPLRGHLQHRFRRLVSTTCIEDGFNHMKTDQVLCKRKKSARPERSLAYVLHRKVLSGRHSWGELQPCSAPPRKGASIPKDVFHLVKMQPSVPAAQMISASATAQHYSPGVEKASSPLADVEMIEQAAAQGNLRMLSQAWLGCFMRWENEVLVRHRASPDEWLLPLGQIGDSAVAMWPMHQKSIPSGEGPFVYFEPEVTMDRPKLVAVLSLEGWEGCRFEFVSPASLARRLPGRDWPTRVLPVRTSEVMPYMKLAARSGFFGVGLPSLQALARYLDVPEAKQASSLYDAVVALASHVLPDASELDIMEMCAKRLVTMRRAMQDDGTQDVMKLDVAADFLDQDDHKELQKLGSRAKSTKADIDGFREAVSKRHGSASGLVVGSPLDLTSPWVLNLNRGPEVQAKSE